MSRKRLILAGFLAFIPVAGQAQYPVRDALIGSYRNCVLITSLGIGGERHMAAEQAFFACSTEEQAVRAWFASVQIDPNLANALVTRLKLDMKRTILADPVSR